MRTTNLASFLRSALRRFQFLGLHDEWQGEWWIMNWGGCGGRPSWFGLGAFRPFAWKDWEKSLPPQQTFRCACDPILLKIIWLSSIDIGVSYLITTSFWTVVRYSFTSCRKNIYATGYILITNLMHWLLFIHKILFFSTCFEAQVLIFSRIQLYTCSIWYCHSVNRWVVEYY